MGCFLIKHCLFCFRKTAHLYNVSRSWTKECLQQQQQQNWGLFRTIMIEIVIRLFRKLRKNHHRSRSLRWRQFYEWKRWLTITARRRNCSIERKEEFQRGQVTRTKLWMDEKKRQRFFFFKKMYNVSVVGPGNSEMFRSDAMRSPVSAPMATRQHARWVGETFWVNQNLFKVKMKSNS